MELTPKKKVGNPRLAEVGAPYRFKKGVVTNPSGRGAVVKEVREIARRILEDQGGLEIFTQHVLDPTDKHHWPAMELAFSYAYGKPMEKLEVLGRGETVVRFIIERPGGQPLLPPPETIEGEAHEIEPPA